MDWNGLSIWSNCGQHSVNLFKVTFLAHYMQLQYGDDAGNIATENSSVFSLIQMR